MSDQQKRKHDKPERLLMHPVVGDWLTEQGFEWLYEPVISNTRHRVDFLARREDVVWLVECKIKPSIYNATSQLDTYYKAYGNAAARKVLMLPTDFVLTEWSERICRDADVTVFRMAGDFTANSPLPRRRIADEFPERCTKSISIPAELSRLRKLEQGLKNDWVDLFAQFEIARNNGEIERAAYLAVAIDTIENALGYAPRPAAAPVLKGARP